MPDKGVKYIYALSGHNINRLLTNCRINRLNVLLLLDGRINRLNILHFQLPYISAKYKLLPYISAKYKGKNKNEFPFK